VRSIVDSIPAALLVLVVAGAVVFIVLSGVWAVRRWIPATRDGFDAEVSSQILGVVATLFGLLLAFVIVIEFQAYNTASDNVQAEADDLATPVAVDRDRNYRRDRNDAAALALLEVRSRRATDTATHPRVDGRGRR
jgi:hypothetical protein